MSTLAAHPEIEKHLASKMEGKVYEHIYVTKMFGKFWAVKEWYTVKNGKVYLVNNGALEPSGDSLETLKNDCLLFGKYTAGAPYTPLKIELTAKQLKSKFGF